MTDTMLQSTMSSRDFFVIERTPRKTRVVDHLASRPSVKPVNVAGCRDRSSSSTRRLRKATPRKNEDSSSEMTDQSLYGNVKLVEPALPELVSSYNALDVVAPVSVATRIRRRLKGMKRVPFLNCVSSNLISTEKHVRPAATRVPQRNGQRKIRQRKKSCLSNNSGDPLDTEPSIRIRALFPETAESRKKIVLTDSLSKLKNSVMFKSRSLTPTKAVDISERSEARNLSPIHASGARRCRRQENLVKMMEKTLEERDDEKEDEEEKPDTVMTTPRRHASPQERTQNVDCTPDAKRDRRQTRNRKIKNSRPKNRKAAHRRTATC